MNIAKISANGQVTVPIEIRKRLKLKEGDKLLFMELSNGEVVIKNSSLVAITEAQMAVQDVDVSEDMLLNDVMQVRYGDQA